MSVPDQKLVLPKQFDNVTKRGIRRDPKGFVKTLLGIEADEFQVIETEQLSVNNPKLKHGACAKRIPSVHSTS